MNNAMITSGAVVRMDETVEVFLTFGGAECGGVAQTGWPFYGLRNLLLIFFLLV